MPLMVHRGIAGAADWVRKTANDGKAAQEQALRMVASRSARDLRKAIRANFGSDWRVWNAPGFAKAIKVKRVQPGWWQVFSKAVYVKGRTQPVDLLWVFDQAPVVTSGFGKGGVAIPIPGQTPIAASGRRFMWPSEASARGWMLEMVAIPGKSTKVIMGRQNSHEPWRPLWVWKPSVRMPKRLDLDAIHARHAAELDQVWADIMDGRIAKGVTRLAA